jgi:hypothetical protein
VYQWLSDKAGSSCDQDAPRPCLVLQALEPLLASTNVLTEPPLPPWTKPAPERVRTYTHSCMNLTSSAIQQNTEDGMGLPQISKKSSRHAKEINHVARQCLRETTRLRAIKNASTRARSMLCLNAPSRRIE